MRGSIATVITLLMIAGALAQDQREAQGDHVRLVPLYPSSAKELRIVRSDGQVVKASKEVQLRLHTEILTQSETIGELLRRNGLAEDDTTKAMLKRLNPGYDFRSGVVSAGRKLDLFVPKTVGLDGEWSTAKYQHTFDSPFIAKLALRDQVTEAASIRTTAYSLPMSTYETPAVGKAYREAVTDIDHTAKLLEARAESLSPADFAVARYQIDFAARQAAVINGKALGKETVFATDIATLRNAAAPTQEISVRLMSGQSPLPLRRVKVSVLKDGTTEDVKGLQVYVLPSGFFNAPQLFKLFEVISYMTRFSFIDETSPATQDVPVFDARIWIGPKSKHAEMAQLVKQGKIKTYQSIDDPNLTRSSVDLLFRSPGDLVQP